MLKMRYIFMASILLLPVLFFVPDTIFAAKQLPVEVNPLWEFESYYIAACGDIDKDSVEKLIRIEADFCLQVMNQCMSAASATRVVEKGTFIHHALCGGYDFEHIWASFLRNDSLYLLDVMRPREIFITTGIDIQKPSGWNGNVKQLEIGDINSDGKLEVVINVNIGWDLRPRGIFVIDWETGQLLWKFLCGPIVESFSLISRDEDGKQEILCGTQAVGNGNVDNEMADWLSYVFMLDADGSLIWKKQIGVYSSRTDARWFENLKTQNKQIVVVERGNPIFERKHDSIFLLDKNNGEFLAGAQYGMYNQGYAIVHDKKGYPFLVTIGSDDTLRMLDENLQLVRKKFLNGGGAYDIISGRFLDQTEPLILVATRNGQILLFNQKFRLLSEYKTYGDCKLFPVKYYHKSRLLICHEKYPKHFWQFVEFNETPFLHRRIPVFNVIIGAMLLLILFSIGMIYARYTKTRDIRTVIKGLTGKSGVIEINHKGDIINISQKARDILNIKDKTDAMTKLSELKQLTPILELARSMISDLKTQSPQETAVSISQEQSYRVRCIRVKKGVLITFEDISAVEYMKRMSSWAPVAQKLAHGIKTPLMNIQLSAEQLESACAPVKDKTDKIIDGIKSEAKRLRKLTDNFMRFTQFAHLNLSSENINDILNELCNKYSLSIPQSIKIECNLTNNLPKLMLDRKEMENAIAIIVENAIESMISSEQREVSREKQTSKVLSVKTSISEKQDNNKVKKYIVIEISDTGKGIPQKYLSELFKPYFTYGKPEGTGLGLPLAKKIIESHNGNIEINSKENIGTTVTICLPV
ncbi:MAG: hypothetical protein KGZ86_02300 [Candidatus Latescibacteria bacterium]|nr:hypothetical protein [Candidatus Latescibacterota bacterium]